METTKRFDEAVTKLYNAFNKGELNVFKCRQCAVGNMCNNNGKWSYLTMRHGKGKNSLTIYRLDLLIGLEAIKSTGYNATEILTIEKLFIEGIGLDENKKIKKGTKEEQFNGLMAVIDYLAELDNIKVPQITVEQFRTVLTEA